MTHCCVGGAKDADGAVCNRAEQCSAVHEARVGLVVQAGDLGRPAAGRLVPREDDQALQNTGVDSQRTSQPPVMTSCGCTRYVRRCLAQLSIVRAQAGHLSPARLPL